jgi:hypothetical protein
MKLEHSHWVTVSAFVIALGVMAIPQDVNKYSDVYLAQVGFIVPTTISGSLAPFIDVDIQTDRGRAATYLLANEIIDGYAEEYSQRSFRGDLKVNRAEAAKMLLNAANIPVDTGASLVYEEVVIPTETGSYIRLVPTSPFEDIELTTWYAPYIHTAKYYEIIDGYPDNYFRPAQTINNAEFIKMASKTFDLPERLPYRYTDFHPSEWYRIYAGAAWQYHFFPEHKNIYHLEPSALLTRYEIALALYQILTYGTDSHIIKTEWDKPSRWEAPLELKEPVIQSSASSL